MHEDNDSDNEDSLEEQLLREALSKTSSKRSYEEVLLIKSYLSKVEFVSSKYSTNQTEQLDDLCRTVTFEVIEPFRFLFKKGDYADKVYVVYTGQISLLDSSISKDAGGERDVNTPQTKLDQYTRRTSLHEARRLSAEAGTTKQRRGNVQFVYPTYAFGMEGITDNQARPMCAVNETTKEATVIAIEKGSYMKFISGGFDANKEPMLGFDVDEKFAKEYLIKVLKKPRYARSSAEIEAISSLIKKQLSFFSQFKADQMRELCRIVEYARFWDRQLLFKQGNRSEAFYGILTGNVEVWVDRRGSKGDPDDIGADVDQFAAQLGSLETYLPLGVTFGERSFATTDLLRLSSVVTGDGLTELLVVPREAYISLVSVIRNADEMTKVSILRKTNIFRQLDAVHLQSFAQAMKPITYRIGDEIYKAGWSRPQDYQGWGSMPGMTVIVSGECSVETEIEVGTEKANATPGYLRTRTSSSAFVTGTEGDGGLYPNPNPNPGKTIATRMHKIKLGLIGPGHILYHFNVITAASQSLPGAGSEEDGEASETDLSVYYTETVTATSPVQAYQINRSDYYHKLSQDTRVLIAKEVTLDNTASLTLTEDKWKKTSAWALFRNGVLNGKFQEEVQNTDKEDALICYNMYKKFFFTTKNAEPMLKAPPKKAATEIHAKRSDGSRWHDREFEYDTEYIRGSLKSMFTAKPSRLTSRDPSRTIWGTFTNRGGDYGGFGGEDDDGGIAANLHDAKQIMSRDSAPADKAIRKNIVQVVSQRHRLAYIGGLGANNLQKFGIDVKTHSIHGKQGQPSTREQTPQSIGQDESRSPRSSKLPPLIAPALTLSATAPALPLSPSSSPVPAPTTPHHVRIQTQRGTVDDEEDDGGATGGTGKSKEKNATRVLPFVLVHIHIENMETPGTDNTEAASAGTTTGIAKVSTPAQAQRPTSRSRLSGLGGKRDRSVRCHMRLSGSMLTSALARLCAESQIEHAVLNSRERSRESEEKRYKAGTTTSTGISFRPANDKDNYFGNSRNNSMKSTKMGAMTTAVTTTVSGSGSQDIEMHWKQFTGFESIDAHHSDHFIIYCRNAPIEHASFTPPRELDINFLRSPYPFSCKSIGQSYIAFAARALTQVAINAITMPNTNELETASAEAGSGAGAGSVSRPAGPFRARSKRGLRSEHKRDVEFDSGDDSDSDMESNINSIGSDRDRDNTQMLTSLSLSNSQKKGIAQPLFLLELLAFAEALATSPSKSEAAAYAATIPVLNPGQTPIPARGKSLVDKRAEDEYERGSTTSDMNAHEKEREEVGAKGIVVTGSRPAMICVAPLYEWFIISDETLLNMRVRYVDNLGSDGHTRAFGHERHMLTSLLRTTSRGRTAGGGGKTVQLLAQGSVDDDSSVRGLDAGGVSSSSSVSAANVRIGSSIGSRDLLKKLQKVIQERKDIITANDRLCIDETQTRIRQQRRATMQAGSGSRSGAGSGSPIVQLSTQTSALSRSTKSTGKQSKMASAGSMVGEAQTILANQCKNYATKPQLKLLDTLMEFSPPRIVVVDNNFRMDG